MASMPSQVGLAQLGTDGVAQQPQADPAAFINTPHIQSPLDSPEVNTVNEPTASNEDSLRRYVESVNIADELEDNKLNEIGAAAKRGFEDDLMTRSNWEEQLSEWTKLAAQIKEEKSYPWRNASNVQYPLLSTAAMQFNARAYPSLVPSNGSVVLANVIGKDPDGQKLEKATRIGKYMSYQLLYEMDNWEEEMDEMLMMLPILGTMFKKTYWDPVSKKNKSCLVMPKDLVVNYWTRTLEDSERVSEILWMSSRKVKEKQKAGVYRKVDIGSAPAPDIFEHKIIRDNMQGPAGQDSTTPHQIIEQHTFLDLNDDGYEEPYIVTFDRASGEVLRITARFDEMSFVRDDKGEVVEINPIQYYTKFGFIPNPDGGFYNIGFGALLGPINAAVNTLINQQIDAGTLANMQGGFIGKGLRVKMGEQAFQPGEWKAVNATGDDLKKQIVPLPAKEPSPVLFQLMNALITSGKELASVAEIFVGKMPGQNTPATTTMASIEQGMKVFTAVYKRIYRSLDSEIRKLFRLNYVYLDIDTYAAVIDTQVQPTDFDPKGFDIMPAADPTASSGQEKLGKAQALAELLQLGVLDPVKVVMRILDAQEQPNWQELISPTAGQPQPDPKMLEMQAKAQADQQKAQVDMQTKQMSAELDARSKQAQMVMDAQMHQQKMQQNAQEAALKAKSQVAMDRAKMFGTVAKAHTDMANAKAQSDANVQATHTQAKAKAAANKTVQRSKPSTSTKKK